MKSSIRQPHFRPGSLRTTGSAHTLLLQMARTAEELQELAEVAERIKQLRDMAGVSQEKAANAIGVSVRGYRAWEAAASMPTGKNRKALATYYGTTPDYIRYGVVKRKKAPTPEPFKASADVLRRLTSIDEQLALLRANNEERHAELLQRIDERTAPIQRIPPRQRRA